MSVKAYDRLLIRAQAARELCPRDLLPAFDRLVKQARAANVAGHPHKAGVMLMDAEKLARRDAVLAQSSAEAARRREQRPAPLPPSPKNSGHGAYIIQSGSNPFNTAGPYDTMSEAKAAATKQNLLHGGDWRALLKSDTD